MKIIAWNVNGIRSLLDRSELFDMLKEENPDIFCMGETKVSCPFFDVQDKLKEKIPRMRHRYWSPCKTKQGYSGTAVFSRKKPSQVVYGLKDINGNEIDDEGRVITCHFKKFILVHVYTPNSGHGLPKLEFRVKTWDPAMRKYIKELEKEKPVVYCGDLNVAHKEIDIANPKSNKKTAGFTQEERDSFTKTLEECELIDTYRHLNPTKVEYSFWTNLFKARERNVGWRLDYFLVNKNKINLVKKSEILTKVMGSDHAPIKLRIKF